MGLSTYSLLFSLSAIVILPTIFLGYSYAHTIGDLGDQPRLDEEGYIIIGHEEIGRIISHEPAEAWILDIADGSVLKKIPTGIQQIGIVMTDDHRYAYVANEESNSVTVIDLYKKEKMRDISVGKNPHELLLSPDGKEVYVANIASKSVSVIDVFANEVTHEIELDVHPMHFAVDPRNYVYIISPDDHTILLLDYKTKQITDSIYLGDIRPSNIWFSPDSSLAYITMESKNALYVMNVVSKVVLNIIPVGERPTFVTASPSRDYLYVSNTGEDTITVINLVSNATHTVTTGPTPLHIEFSPDAKYAYVACAGSNYVSIIDTTDFHVIGKFVVGNNPHALHLLKPHTVVISPLEFLTAIGGIVTGAGLTGLHIKRNTEGRERIVIVLLTSSVLIGSYLAFIDEFMWSVAPSHGYLLLGIIGVNATLIGLMKFNKELAIVTCFISSVVMATLMILDVFTYKDVGLTFKEMLEHIYLQWPFDALLATQILLALTSWIIRNRSNKNLYLIKRKERF